MMAFRLPYYTGGSSSITLTQLTPIDFFQIMELDLYGLAYTACCHPQMMFLDHPTKYLRNETNAYRTGENPVAKARIPDARSRGRLLRGVMTSRRRSPQVVRFCCQLLHQLHSVFDEKGKGKHLDSVLFQGRKTRLLTPITVPCVIYNTEPVC